MSEYTELAFSYPPATDTRLSQDEHVRISRTLDGDLDAFNELVVKYQKLAYSIAYRMLLSRERAADAVQDSFLKAFRALPSFKNGSFKSWFTRIVVNTCHDAIRRDRRFSLEIADDASYENNGESVPYQVIAPHESPQASVERAELHARIELGISALPPEQRVVLVLCDVHGYSYEEISEITGFAMGTVKSRISRARLKMREFLRQQPELIPFSWRIKEERSV
jgi:RNA polymerase sigma-70 factor (ECF subfamily)